MFTISEKSKFELKKASLLLSLFLVLFFLGFYSVNILDLKPAPKQDLQLAIVQNNALLDEELQKNTEKDGINMADFKVWANANKLKGDIYYGDPDGDGLLNFQEYLHGTDPNKADTDGDGFSDKQEIVNGYDPVAPGDAKPLVYVKIQKIGVDVPMVWSQSEDETKMLKDLENGVSHFAKTASPGQNGNAIISGHSSNYVWAKGDYNHIFKDLQTLEKGDIVNIKVVQQNGKIFMYKYQVNDKYITSPEDARIFADTDTPTLTLTTCWPVGTALKRTIIKAEIVKS